MWLLIVWNLIRYMNVCVCARFHQKSHSNNSRIYSKILKISTYWSNINAWITIETYTWNQRQRVLCKINSISYRIVTHKCTLYFNFSCACHAQYNCNCVVFVSCKFSFRGITPNNWLKLWNMSNRVESFQTEKKPTYTHTKTAQKLNIEIRDKFFVFYFCVSKFFFFFKWQKY